MLDALTPEQEALLDQVADKWLQRLYTFPKLNKELAKKQIKWLYHFCDLSEPDVIFLDSPLACQMTAHELCGNHDCVRDRLRECMGDRVKDRVGDHIRDHIENRVRDRVHDNVWNHVWDCVGDRMPGHKEISSFASYGNISDYGWCSSYEFFALIGILTREETKDFRQFCLLLESGIYDMIQLKSRCVACGMPENISMNNNGPSIHWADGYTEHFSGGMPFNNNLSQKVMHE